MKRLCAWCGAALDPTQTTSSPGRLTHGLCASCRAQFFPSSKEPDSAGNVDAAEPGEHNGKVSEAGAPDVTVTEAGNWGSPPDKTSTPTKTNGV